VVPTLLVVAADTAPAVRVVACVSEEGRLDSSRRRRRRRRRASVVVRFVTGRISGGLLGCRGGFVGPRLSPEGIAAIVQGSMRFVARKAGGYQSIGTHLGSKSGPAPRTVRPADCACDLEAVPVVATIRREGAAPRARSQPSRSSRASGEA
jgi:hypothetical protein